MPKVEIILQTTSYENIGEPVKIESSFVPRAGDIIDTYDLQKNPDKQNGGGQV